MKKRNVNQYKLVATSTDKMADSVSWTNLEAIEVLESLKCDQPSEKLIEQTENLLRAVYRERNFSESNADFQIYPRISGGN